MQLPPATSLEKYLTSPSGPISEVMIAMHDAGKTPLEIMQEAYDYRHTLAKELESMTAGAAFFADLTARFEKTLLQV